MTEEFGKQSDQQKAANQFAIARSDAINQYAELEMHLALLFQRILGADIQKSYVVFSSILNTQARLKMMGKLLHLSFGDEYKIFFDSLSKKLRGIDSTRNKIAHWIVLHSETGGKAFDPRKDVALHAHPDLFAGGKLYKHEIDDFREKARFYSKLTHQFAVCVKFSEALDAHDAQDKPWREVFKEEVSFPPQPNHPLVRLLI